MKEQHTKIRGYRDLSQEEINLMNEIKLQGEVLQKLCNKIDEHQTQQCQKAYNDQDEMKRIVDAEVPKWLHKGKESIQEGIMFLVRAVAQPTTF